jgi:hypothetical protein
MFKSGFDKISFNWAAAAKGAGRALGTRSSLMHGAAGALGGAVQGATAKDDQGNMGGLGGAIRGGVVGGAGAMAGHAALKGFKSGRGTTGLTNAPKLLSAPPTPKQLPVPSVANRPMRDVTPRKTNMGANALGGRASLPNPAPMY